MTVTKLPGMKPFLVALLTLVRATGEASSLDQHADKLANLIDPAKLATLGRRRANSRVQKAVAILAEAEFEKLDPGAVCAAAIETVKMKPAAGALTKAALLRNLDIARELGCLDSAGLDDMRHGRAPTIRRGPYEDDELSVDHIMPRAVVPELDHVEQAKQQQRLVRRFTPTLPAPRRRVQHRQLPQPLLRQFIFHFSFQVGCVSPLAVHRSPLRAVPFTPRSAGLRPGFGVR